MTQSVNIAQMPTSGNDYLTLEDIAEFSGVTYRTLRQYSDQECVRRFMGGYKAGKGYRYPLDSRERWTALLETVQKGLIQPSTVSAWLSNLTVSTDIAAVPEPTTGNELATIAQLPTLGIEAIALLRQLVSMAPPPDDCLLDAARAAELLACKPTTVRRYVSPVRRGRWRKSDILRHIQALTPAR